MKMFFDILNVFTVTIDQSIKNITEPPNFWMV